MRQGLGVLNWSPQAFWDATPWEFNLAIVGWLEAQGQDPDALPEPMTRAELNELMARFPDGQ